MSSPVTLRPRARLDLLDQFVYFGEQVGVELAERYLTAVDETCRRLAVHPLSGALYDSGITRLKGLRRVPISGFEGYLIFYLPTDPGITDPGIDVVRALHGALDIDNLFGLEEA